MVQQGWKKGQEMYPGPNLGEHEMAQEGWQWQNRSRWWSQTMMQILSVIGRFWNMSRIHDYVGIYWCGDGEMKMVLFWTIVDV